jgi:hypothetical protein
MKRLFSLILFLSSTLFVLTACGKAHSTPKHDSHKSESLSESDLNTQIVKAQQMIDSLEAQLQLLVPPQPLGSTSAANVRTICSADFMVYCKDANNQNTMGKHDEHEKDGHDEHDQHEKDGHDEHDQHEKDGHDEHDQHEKDGHDEHEKNGHDEHDQHEKDGHKQHGKNGHGRFLSDHKKHHSKCNHKPLLVFGSFENDMCMLSNLDQLSLQCQESIQAQIQLNEQKHNEFSNAHYRAHGGMFILFIILSLVCVCKRHHQHRKRMRKFVDVLHENPEIRSAVERIVGEPLPPRPRCCFMNEHKKAFLRFVFLTWLIASSIVALVFLVLGMPFVTVVNVLFGSFIGILLLLLVACFIKKTVCCFRRLCCSRSCPSTSSSPASSFGNTSIQNNYHYHIVPNADQFDPNEILSAAQQFNNGNAQMAYYGLPVAPPNQTAL